MKTRIPTLVAVLAASLAVPAIAATFKVDSTHSTVIFRVKHMNASYAYGRFNAISGTFSIDEADPSESSFDFTIKADSIDTADAKRDAHLKRADFFNAAQHPTITFKSTTVKAATKGTYDVTGDLKLHGVTRPITVKVEHSGTSKGMGGGTIAGIESTFTIKRSDFGMKGMLGVIGDDVTIILSSEGGAK